MLPAISAFEALGFYYYKCGQPHSAVNSFKEAISIAPGKFSPKFMLFNYYRLTNNMNEARLTAKDILNTDVKVPSDDVDTIRNEAKAFLTNGK